MGHVKTVLITMAVSALTTALIFRVASIRSAVVGS